MKNKTITIILLALCVIFGGISAGIIISKDRTAPELTVLERDIVYVEGADRNELLVDVMAVDDVDGDLTDEIFIDTVVTVGDNTAVVYYAVLDSSNNIAKAKRTIRYVPNTTSIDEESGLVVENETPTIILSETSKTINIGDSFNELSVVEEVKDNKDSMNTLYYKITVDGYYDTTKEGTYTLQYTVTDTDGNTSEAVTFYLTVK